MNLVWPGGANRRIVYSPRACVANSTVWPATPGPASVQSRRMSVGEIRVAVSRVADPDASGA
ncbi:hypothetical protein ACNTMW_21660 [Planosporangium sp. 12N6]|uniref:hypothetical protein n=1 Tax=Planosporangium spinosum TaxID=3402278 RepID=UPI003CF711CD